MRLTISYVSRECELHELSMATFSLAYTSLVTGMLLLPRLFVHCLGRLAQAKLLRGSRELEPAGPLARLEPR